MERSNYRRTLVAALVGAALGAFDGLASRALAARESMENMQREIKRSNHVRMFGSHRPSNRHRSPYAEQKQGGKNRKSQHHGKRARSSRRRARLSRRA